MPKLQAEIRNTTDTLLDTFLNAILNEEYTVAADLIKRLDSKERASLLAVGTDTLLDTLLNAILNEEYTVAADLIKRIDLEERAALLVIGIELVHFDVIRYLLTTSIDWTASMSISSHKSIAESLIALESEQGVALLKAFPMLRESFDASSVYNLDGDTVYIYDFDGNTLFTHAASLNDFQRLQRIYALDPSQLTKTNRKGENALDVAIKSETPATEMINWLFERMEKTENMLENMLFNLAKNAELTAILIAQLERPDPNIDKILKSQNFTYYLTSQILIAINKNMDSEVEQLDFLSPYLRPLLTLMNRLIDRSNPSPIHNHFAARYFLSHELTTPVKASEPSTLRDTSMGLSLFSHPTETQHQRSPIDEPDSKGRTALHHLMLNAPKRLYERLRCSDDGLGGGTRAAMNIGHFITKNLAVDAAKLTLNRLIAAGARIDIPDNEGNTPLHYAALWHSQAFLTYFIEQGAPVNAQNNAGITPFMFACMQNKTNVITALLAQGANPSITDKEGNNALFYFDTMNDRLYIKQKLAVRSFIEESMNTANRPRI